MARQIYPHYICDYCGNEVIERSQDDIKSWVAIKRGRNDFTDDNPLLITYMGNGWQDRTCNEYLNNLIEHNLYFCCADCAAKFIGKHLGTPKISLITTSPDPNVTPKREPTRFDDIVNIGNPTVRDPEQI